MRAGLHQEPESLSLPASPWHPCACRARLPHTPSVCWLQGPWGGGECLGQAKGVLWEEDREESGEGRLTAGPGKAGKRP